MQSFSGLIDLFHLVLEQLLCISAVLEIALLFERANASDSGLNSLVFASELEKTSDCAVVLSCRVKSWNSE